MGRKSAGDIYIHGLAVPVSGRTLLTALNDDDWLSAHLRALPKRVVGETGEKGNNYYYFLGYMFPRLDSQGLHHLHTHTHTDG